MCLDDQVGSLGPDKRADIVLLNLDAWPRVPLNDAKTNLVYAENGSSVTDVLVNGEVVVRDGRLTRVDESEVMAEVRARLPAILAQRQQWEAIARRHEPSMKALYRHCMGRQAPLNRRADAPAG